MLNSDQKNAIFILKNFWNNKNNQNIVITGAGGTGKTFLVDTLLKSLPNCHPLILAPTNEALFQLQEKVCGNYTFKTVHSALGISPSTHKKEITFELLGRLPKIWDEVNLAIVDECGMIDEFILNILLSIGIKIIFLGHESQLPEIKKERKFDDPCISPIFTKNFPTVALTIPQRNTGLLWDFNLKVEETIYDHRIVLPTTFDVTTNTLKNLCSVEQSEKFLTGERKIAVWSNRIVDEYNSLIRKNFFGSLAENNLYLPTDKLIFCAPCTLLEGFESYNEKWFYKNLFIASDFERIYSNAKFEVLKVEEITFKFNAFLSFPLYKLTGKLVNDVVTIYSFKNVEDYTRLSTFLEQQAWGKKTKQDKELAFRRKHFVMGCFANLKHYYAATCHRLQGATIPEVIVINKAIMSNPVIYEARKCRYVATSRAAKELFFYRG